MPEILVDGLPVPHIPSDDRGLAYGDGLFETLSVAGGRPRNLHRHLARLQRGCERLRIAIEPLAAQLEAEIKQLSASSTEPSAVLKVVVTRGSSSRGYAVDPSAPPRRILRLAAAATYPGQYRTEGISLGLCDTRLSINPALAGIKHLNRLEQVLARMELGEGLQEGLLLDAEGCIVEGIFSNLFVVFGDQLITPPVDRCGVAGIAREVVLEKAADQGVAVAEQRLRLADLQRAEGAFMTNSLIGAWPVRRFQNLTFNSVAWADVARQWLSSADKGVR